MVGKLTKDRFGRFELLGRKLFSGDVIELCMNGRWFHVIVNQRDDIWYADFPSIKGICRLGIGMLAMWLDRSQRPVTPYKS